MRTKKMRRGSTHLTDAAQLRRRLKRIERDTRQTRDDGEDFFGGLTDRDAHLARQFTSAAVRESGDYLPQEPATPHYAMHTHARSKKRSG